MIQKIISESSIDFPGKFGPVIFTSGCNFRCGFCHNPDLIGKSKISKKELEELELELKKIKVKTENKWYNGITITGGEPLMHNLDEIIKKFRELGLDIKLDTNGSFPDKLKDLIDRELIDYVAMDIKARKEDYGKVAGVKINIENIEKSVKILSDSEIKFELRTTIIPFPEEKRFMNLEEIEKMRDWIFSLTGKRMKWVLQSFVSRDKGEVLNDEYSKENLKFELQETPKELLEQMKKILEKNFDCEIR